MASINSGKRSWQALLAVAAAVLFLCVVTANAQDATPVDAATALTQADPSAVAPRSFGSSVCNRVLPGCQRCLLYLRKPKSNAAGGGKNSTTSNLGSLRRVYVCLSCRRGFKLTGTGNLDDARPRFCTPTGSTAQCPIRPTTPTPNSAGFPSCSNRTVGAICRATCTAPAVGGYTATCTANGTTANWVVTGSCDTGSPTQCLEPPANTDAPNSGGFVCPSTPFWDLDARCTARCNAGFTGGYTATCTFVGGAAVWRISGSCDNGGPTTCPASPPASSAPNSPGFTGCRTTLGSICRATCNAGFSGGYTATCTFADGAAKWVVRGSCDSGSPTQCLEPPANAQAPNSRGFVCPSTPWDLDEKCTAQCNTGFTGSYTATCTFVGGAAVWVYTGSCDNGGPTTCPASPPAGSSPNSGGFSNCPTAVGSECRATCTAPATGPGYTATCTFANGAANWVVRGSCTPPAATCPATPPAGSSPNSGGFSNCPTALGSTCRATCTAPATGPGYTATCALTNGVATWAVIGSCTPPAATCPASPPAGSSPNSGGFSNCPTAVGSTCRATCTAPATGPGYTATCALTNGVATWAVDGSCTTAQSNIVDTCTGNCGRRGLIDRASNRPCQCDYWCNLYNDCCGGMNTAAAAAKDAACPAMAPTANIPDVLTCSNQRGVLAGVDPCASYKPAGCWCDKFCTEARDCCDSCPAQCGATCPARPAQLMTPSSRPSSSSSSPHECGTTELTRLAYINQGQGGLVPAAFTAALESRVQACQDALIQTDTSTPVTDIPVYMVNVRIDGRDSPYVDTARANLLLNVVNAAFARTGLKFTLASLTNAEFPSVDSLAGRDCFANTATCRRCTVARQVVPAGTQASRALIFYMRYFPDPTPGQAITLGAAYLPQSLYSPTGPNNAAGASCVDGLWSLARSDAQAGSAAQAVLEDSDTIIHELGHWLGLDHTWNQNDDMNLNDGDLCDQQVGNDWRRWDFIRDGTSDGVRDTAPQLPRTVGQERNPYFFQCNQDGSGTYRPDATAPALSCNGGSLTQGKYLNNFYNTMSYFTGGCEGDVVRRRTFSAGQVVRMKCVYNCYRLNQCGLGTFPYNPLP